MIEHLVSRVFATRNCAHLAHWNESSGYRHEVLGDFYGDVVDSLDKFIEAYLGNFNDRRISPPASTNPPTDIIECLESDAVWIASNSEALTEDVEVLENILQELLAVYLSTLFKMKRLK